MGYINNAESTEIPTSRSLSSSSSTVSLEHSAINKQLNDLRLQFKNGIKHLQHKEPTIIPLRPSFSMPTPPLFSDSSFDERIKKKSKRKKPRPLTPCNLLNLHQIDENLPPPPLDGHHENNRIIACSPSPSSSSYASNSSAMHRNNDKNLALTQHKNDNEINEKLDVLINIVHSQQKALQTLMKKSSKKEKENKKPKKTTNNK